MPQEPRFTTTSPPTNEISQSAEDDSNCLRNAQLEPSLNPDPIRANTDSRNQEHANRGAQHETGVRTEQLLASGAAEEEAIMTVQTARYDEAWFHRLLQEGRSERPATSSMEIAHPYDHSNDGTMSTEHISTVTPSKRSTQNPQSYGNGTDETGTAEHTSKVPSNTDGTSMPDMDRPDETTGEDHISNLPAQADIILDHISVPPVPPNIIERALRYADQRDVPLPDEEFLRFERQPFEAQKHTMRVFFKEMAYMEMANMEMANMELANMGLIL